MSMSLYVESESVRIDGVNYLISTYKNERANDSALIQFKKFLITSEGALTFVDLLSKSFRLAVEVTRLTKNPALASRIQGPGSVLNKMVCGTLIPLTIISWCEYKQAADLWSDNKSTQEFTTGEKTNKIMQAALKTLTSICYTSLQFIPGHARLKSTALVADLFNEGLEAGRHCRAERLIEVILDENKIPSNHITAVLADQKRQHFLGTIQPVMELVRLIFGFLALISTTAIAPPAVSATICLFSVILSLIRNFHQVNMRHHCKIEQQVIQIGPAR